MSFNLNTVTFLYLLAVPIGHNFASDINKIPIRELWIKFCFSKKLMIRIP